MSSLFYSNQTVKQVCGIVIIQYDRRDHQEVGFSFQPKISPLNQPQFCHDILAALVSQSQTQKCNQTSTKPFSIELKKNFYLT